MQNQPLTEKEKKKLEVLDNPDIEYLSPSSGMIPFMVASSIDSRKNKVVKLRTKMRLYELQIDPDQNHQEYYKIVEEEEQRFNERFKKKKS